MDQSGKIAQIFSRGLVRVANPNPAGGIKTSDLKAFLNVIYHYTMNGRDSVLNP